MATKSTSRKRKARSSSRAKYRRTPEERQAEVDALKEQQAAAVKALVEADAWKAYLSAGSLFRSYSLHNTLLILMQCPEATRVAGFNTWKKLGRYVTTGPGSGLKIWGKPYHPKRWVPEGEVPEGVPVLDRKNGEALVRASYTRCAVVKVFDISQTAGDPLPSISERLSDSDAEETAVAQEVIAALRAWLIDNGWTVAEGTLPGETNGTTNHSTRRITLREGLSVLQQAKTLIHEAAHAVLHEDDTWAPISQYAEQQHRGVAEVQAESVAYVVAGLAGLDTSTYSTGYVAGWAAAAARSDKPEDILAVIETTAKAVHHAVGILADVVDGVAESDAADDAADGVAGDILAEADAPLAAA